MPPFRFTVLVHHRQNNCKSQNETDAQRIRMWNSPDRIIRARLPAEVRNVSCSSVRNPCTKNVERRTVTRASAVISATRSSASMYLSGHVRRQERDPTLRTHLCQVFCGFLRALVMQGSWWGIFWRCFIQWQKKLLFYILGIASLFPGTIIVSSSLDVVKSLQNITRSM